MRQIYIVRHPFLILAKRHRHTKSTKPAPPLSSSSSSSSFDCDSNSSINNNNARPSLAPLRKTNQWTERREQNNEFIQISTKNLLREQQMAQSNVPVAIAVFLGFSLLGAILYPAAQAMTKAMEKMEKAMEESLKAFSEGEKSAVEWQLLGEDLRVLLNKIEQWGKPLGDANIASWDLEKLGEQVKENLADVLETSLGRTNVSRGFGALDEGLFKWQDAIADVIEDLTNLSISASKGEKTSEQTLRRALNQAKIASESLLISSSVKSSNNKKKKVTKDDDENSADEGEEEEEEEEASLVDDDRSYDADYVEGRDDFDIRTKAESEDLKQQARRTIDSMDIF